MDVDALVTDLRRLGVRAGDVVMVHASLRAIEPVDGGAEGVIEAISDAIGDGGTMLMVIGSRDVMAWNFRPRPARAGPLVGTEPFDALRTPADPDVGTLAEVFRTFPETVVSDHPEGRFAARGALADAFVADLPWHDYYGPGSALERLVEAGGRVLRLGANPDTVTLTHYAEYLADVPGKRRVRRYRLVGTSDGPRVRVIECLDDSEGIVDHPGEDYFATILREYLRTGEARTGVVGRARSELLDAEPYVTFAARWMSDHLGG